MSRKRKSRKKPKHNTIKLLVGYFYNVHDGSPKGHPGRIEKADYENDIYISITTHSLTEEEYLEKKNSNNLRKDYKELLFPTTNDVFKSFVNKRPFVGTREDFGNIIFLNMSFNEKDYEILKKVLSRTPRIGFWYKKTKKPSK